MPGRMTIISRLEIFISIIAIAAKNAFRTRISIMFTITNAIAFFAISVNFISGYFAIR